MRSFNGKKPVDITVELLLQQKSRKEILNYWIENHKVTERTAIFWYSGAKKILPALKKQAQADAEAEKARIAAEKAARERVTKEGIEKKLWKMAQADVRNMYNADGTLKKIFDLDDETAAGLLFVQVYQGEEPEKKGQILAFKFANPKYVLDSLAKLKGYNTPPAEDIPEDEFDLESLEIKFK